MGRISRIDAMKHLCLFAALSLLCSITLAEDWPQWRGPALNGSSTQTNLPDTLDPKTNLAWSIDLPGNSAATPIVVGERLFTTALDRNSQKLTGYCIEAKTGNVLWSKQIGTANDRKSNNDLAGPSPICDGKMVYFYFGTGDLAAFDMEGKELWARNIAKDHGEFNVNWLYASSPLLFKGKLYIQVLHRNVPASNWNQPGPNDKLSPSYLLAIDPANGKDIWQQIRPTDARAESQESYATPTPWQGPDHAEILLIGGDCMTGHDAETGKELWRASGWNPTRKPDWRLVPSITVAGDYAIGCAPKHGPVMAVKLGQTGTVQFAWTTKETTSDVPVPLFYQGNLYVLDGDFKKGISCLNQADGQVKWFAPIQSPRAVFRASPTGADGKIYCMNEAGEVFVLSASDGKMIFHTQLQSGGRSRGSIAPANGMIFIRTSDKLYAFKR
jgi:outer membrane protein assembly factor BamB